MARSLQAVGRLAGALAAAAILAFLAVWLGTSGVPSTGPEGPRAELSAGIPGAVEAGPRSSAVPPPSLPRPTAAAVPRAPSGGPPVGQGPPKSAAAPAPVSAEEAEWQALPLRDMEQLPQASYLVIGEAFNDANPFAGCMKDWPRPKGMTEYQAELEMRLQARDGGYVLAEVRVRDSSARDPALEDCVREASRGIPVSLSDSTFGPRARLRMASFIHFRTPQGAIP